MEMMIGVPGIMGKESGARSTNPEVRPAMTGTTATRAKPVIRSGKKLLLPARAG